MGKDIKGYEEQQFLPENLLQPVTLCLYDGDGVSRAAVRRNDPDPQPVRRCAAAP